MKYEPGRGMRSETDRSNDGYVDQMARRGAEKGVGCGAWVLIVIIALIVIGGILSIKSDPSAFEGVMIAVFVLVALNKRRR